MAYALSEKMKIIDLE